MFCLILNMFILHFSLIQSYFCVPYWHSLNGRNSLQYLQNIYLNDLVKLVSVAMHVLNTSLTFCSSRDLTMALYLQLCPGIVIHNFNSETESTFHLPVMKTVCFLIFGACVLCCCLMGMSCSAMTERLSSVPFDMV